MGEQANEDAKTAQNTSLMHRQSNGEPRVFYDGSQPTLHHVSLFVADTDASIDFYTNGLGLALQKKFDDIIGVKDGDEFPFQIESIFLEAGDGRYVELHPLAEAEMSAPGFPLNHLALAVEDVDAAYRQALAHGGAPFGFTLHGRWWDGAPLDVVMTGRRPEPMRMAFLQGPNNELVELYQSSTNNSPSI